MKKRAEKYFILAKQYLETSRLLLKTLIESGNTNWGFGESEKEACEEADRNALNSDTTLFIPAIFNCYQSIELIVKGLILLNNQEFKCTHKVKILISQLESIYTKQSEVYIKINDFYNKQIEIINNFKNTNRISTTKELYEALRYPESNNSNVEGKKFYDYYDLKYNGDFGIENFKCLYKRLQDLKNVVFKEYNNKC